MFITRRTLKLLANRQALVSGVLARRLFDRPLAQVQARSSQETVYALTRGVNAAVLLVLGQFIVAATEVSLLSVMLVGLVLIDPAVSIFALFFFAGVGFFVHNRLSGWAYRSGADARNSEIASFSTLQETLGTYREVTVLGRRNLFAERFMDLRLVAARVASDQTFIGLVPKYIFEMALIVGAVLLAMSQIATNSLPGAIATLAIFLAASTRVVPSMLRLQGAFITVRAAVGQADPTFELRDDLSIWEEGDASRARVVDPDQIETFQPLTQRNGSVSAEKISVSYGAGLAYALMDVSLTIASGASVALVGPTGAGKSTLADVILGVTTPSTGSVTVGGLAPSLRSLVFPGSMSYVPQSVGLVSGSVRDNVALGVDPDDIQDERIWEVLEAVHLADYLGEYRDGLDTLVGEGGLRFSGGQRQRIGLARALYELPSLLVLDEATSALDAETEQVIGETMRKLEGVTTTVIIAHRLATVRHCDVVFYLESGRIKASGDFEALRGSVQAFDAQARLQGL